MINLAVLALERAERGYDFKGEGNSVIIGIYVN
jgi:hypothetical protein